MKRLALNWAGPALCAILVIYVVNERTKAIGSKMNYKREQINGLRKEVRELHRDWDRSFEEIRGDLHGTAEPKS